MADRHRRDGALALIVSAQFVIALDTTIVNMALPAMARQLELSAVEASWVVNAYILAFGGFLLVGGQLADVLGPRRSFSLGLAGFGLASLSAGLAFDPLWLIASRGAQGLAGAIVAPSGLALLSRLHADGRERTRALGAWGAAGAAGAPAGALLGGVLTETLGWASVLLVNVPICMLTPVLVVRVLPRVAAMRERGSTDLAGALTATSGVTLLIYAIVDADRTGWGSLRNISLLAVACLLLTGLVVVERRVAVPLLPRRLVRARGIVGANVAALIGGMPLYGLAFCLTMYVQRTLGYGPFLAGLSFLPFGVVAIMSARLAPHVISQHGSKAVVVVGLVLVSVGLLPLTGIAASGEYVTRLLPALIVIAIGMAFFLVAINVAGLAGVHVRECGVASGLVTATQQIGGALGLGITVATFELASANAGALAGVHAGLAVDAGLALVAALAALAWIPGRRGQAHARTALGNLD